MLIARRPDIPTGEITDETVYATRREFLAAAGFGLAAVGGLLPMPRLGLGRPGARRRQAHAVGRRHRLQQLLRVRHRQGGPGAQRDGRSGPGPGRSRSPARSPSRRRTISTTCSRASPPEERVYRHRCVEAWSMVVPWTRHPARRAHRPARADQPGQVRRVHHAARSAADAGPAAQPSSTGRTSRGSGWTRRCTR